MARRYRPARGPDLHVVIFVGLIATSGIVFLVAAGLAYAKDGWEGRVSLRSDQGEFTVAQAVVIGCFAVLLAAFIGWASRSRPGRPKS